MKNLFLLLLLCPLVSACCSVGRRGFLFRLEHDWESGGFVIPEDVIVYVSVVEGSAEASSEIGFGRDRSKHEQIFKNLPHQKVEEIRVGRFAKNTVLPLSIKTRWRGKTYWAFSGDLDEPSGTTFMDLDNSLGYDAGRVAERVKRDTWHLHLDDAASYTLRDDSDDDIIVQIRLERE